MTSHARRGLPWVLALLCMPCASFSQGQDSTPGERNVLVMAELLPGVYDNVNQSYFDGRRKLPESERHLRVETTIERIEAPALGPHAFVWTDRLGTADSRRAATVRVTLHAGPGADEVTMRVHAQNGCEWSFRRRADHFSGVRNPGTCGPRAEIQLAASSLWFTEPVTDVAAGPARAVRAGGSAEPFWLERAQRFHCYVDVPGVGGGRDIPFERYDDITLNDKGGAHWFMTREAEPRQLGISLQAVTWHVLNENNGNFNRNSLVLYAMEKLADGSVKEHGYAFTQPDADRIGMNLKWMLANCAKTRRAEARPEM